MLRLEGIESSESLWTVPQIIKAGLFVFSKRKEKALTEDGHSATGRQRANVNKSWL